MRPPLSKIPLLPVATGVVAGILFILYFPDMFAAGSLAAIVISAILIWKGLWWVASVLLFFIPGAFAMSLQPRELTREITGIWEGEITEVSTADNAVTASLRISGRMDDEGSLTRLRPFTVRIVVPSPDSIYMPGQVIRCDATLRPLSNASDLPYERTEWQRLRYRGYSATAMIPEKDIDFSDLQTIRLRISILRQNVSDIILRAPLSSSTKEFLLATLLGDQSILTADARMEFSRAGMAHILAISGLHVGIIAWIITLVLIPFGLFKYRNAIYIVTTVALWGYAVLTGLSPSVTRAVIMATMIYAGYIFQRSGTPLNSLLLAAILILLFSPLSLLDIGFQMSFGAVAAILLFARHFNIVSPRRRILYFFTSLCSASIAAVIGTGLVGALCFHSFPLLFLLSNIAGSLILPPLMFGGMLLLLLSPSGISVMSLCQFLDFLTRLQESFVSWIASLPVAAVDGIYFPAWILLLWVAGFLMIRLWIHSRKGVFLYSAGMTLLCFITVFCLTLNRPIKYNPRIFIHRGTTATELICDSGDGILSILSSTPPHNHESVKADFIKYNGEWLKRHSIDSVALINGNTIHAGRVSLLLVNKGKRVARTDTPLSHIIICRGFSGTLKALTDSVGTPEIILSADLTPRVFTRLRKEAEEYGLHYISLKDSTYTIPLTSH